MLIITPCGSDHLIIVLVHVMIVVPGNQHDSYTSHFRTPVGDCGSVFLGIIWAQISIISYVRTFLLLYFWNSE